jgi:molybdopterin/thiamine biosynthesis adenylyltransferase
MRSAAWSKLAPVRMRRDMATSMRSRELAKARRPICLWGLRHQVLGQDKTLRVGSGGLLGERVLRLARPDIGHQLEDLRPGLLAWH